MRPARPYQRVLIAGPWCGHANLGDELLAALVIRAVRRAQPRAEVRLVTGDVEAAWAQWGVKAYDWSQGLLRPLVWADCVVAPLATTAYHWPPLATWLLGRAHLLRRPTLALAVGAAAPPGFSEAVVARLARALNHACLITTRDEESRTYLAHIGVRAPMEVTADPVVGMSDEGANIGWLWRALPWSAPQTTPFLAVSICYVPGYAHVPEPAEVAAALDCLARKYSLPTLFVPMDSAPGSDSHYHAQVLMQMRHRNMAHVLSRALSGPEAVRLLGRARLLVSSRLHALILAGCAGTPAVGIARAPKIGAYLARLGAVPVAGSSTPNAEQLLTAVRAQLGRLDVERERVRAANRAMRVCDARNWEVLTEFLYRRLSHRGGGATKRERPLSADLADSRR